MGQRNATYVITESKYKGKQIGVIYNGWNPLSFQLWKLVRAVKFITGISDDCENLFMTYFASQGLSSEVGWNGGIIENDLFRDGSYTDAFQEDNNNGWNIIKIRQTVNDKYKFKIEPIEMCNILGDEDGGDDKHEPVSLRQYFEKVRLILEGKEEAGKKQFSKDIDYLEKNTKYNPGLKEEAVALLKEQLIGKKKAFEKGGDIEVESKESCYESKMADGGEVSGGGKGFFFDF